MATSPNPPDWLNLSATQPPPTAAGAEPAGRLGAYQLVKELGAGGMGRVWLGVHAVTGQRAAVKVLKAEHLDQPGARERFLREARLTAGLRHPNVVGVLDAGEADGQPYLALEYLEGQTLAAALPGDRPAPLALLLQVARETAAGLAAAHEAGLVHRDVKPGNLWLEQAPEAPAAAGPAPPTAPLLRPLRVRILDFGLARPEVDDVHLTRSGTIVGTPAYLAPEQAAGGKVDGRADLFSLGVVLYQLASGRLPFTAANSLGMVLAIQTAAPPPLRELNPTLPAWLADLIHRLLAKDPAQRPASAREFLRLLEAGPTEETTEQPAAAAPPRSGGRRRAALLAALAVLLAVGTWALWPGSPPPAPPAPAATAAGAPVFLRSWPLLEASYHQLRFTADGRLLTASLAPDQTLVAAWDAGTGRRLATLGGWQVEAAALAEGLEKRPLPWQILQWAVTADGRRAAAACGLAGDRRICLWDLARPDAPRRLEHDPGAAVQSLAFSPDGRWLAAGGKTGNSKGSIRVWDAATAAPGWRYEWPGQGWINGLAYSADGRRLFAGALGQEALEVLDAARGRTEGPLGRLTKGVVRPGLTVSADGRRVAVPQFEGYLAVLETDTGRTVGRMDRVLGPFFAYALAPDGLVVGTAVPGTAEVSLWAVDGGRLLQTFALGPGARPVTALAFGPDSRTLATAGPDGQLRLWDVGPVVAGLAP